jgi:hypothetical protein
VKKENLLNIVGGSVKVYSHYEKTVGRFLKKLKIGLLSNSLLVMYPKKMKSRCQRYVWPHVYGSTIHSSQEMEKLKFPPTNE